MITVFDCETTGLLRAGMPAEEQPHLLQLSCALYDGQKRRRGRLTTIMRPDGWSIEPQAELVHGIAERTAHRAGIPPVPALAVLRFFAENSTKIVAHNFEYDWSIIDAALKRAGSAGEWWRDARQKRFCTQEVSTPILNLPGEFGQKFPSLEEAHRFFFPESPYESRHDAEEDADATARVYFAISERAA